MNKTQLLIRQFNLVKYDFMGYHLNKDKATYHHIIKKEHGGEKTMENGAVLMPCDHEYLHLIECVDLKKYNAINNIFKIIHRKGTIEEMDYILINKILNCFEKEHEGERRAKGKLLIKDKFLRRIFK